MSTKEPGDRWSVYMLRCNDGSLYTGATNDLDARLQRHQSGRGARYTRSRLPVTLVFFEPAGDRSAALRREAAVKRLTRASKLVLVRSSSRSAGYSSAEGRGSPAPKSRRR